MQIHFIGTNFINAALFFFWPVAQPVVGELEMHSVCQLSNFADPFSNFFLLKKASKPYLVSENRPVQLSERVVLLSQRVHSHLSLSRSLRLLSSLSRELRCIRTIWERFAW